ncbi:MAG: hypothetical protein E7353_03335 [Clostridiales bacterium]|nr:hypothetical protein [Clostridiales bacterium]
MMKKIIVVLTFLMAVIFAMTGCASESYSDVSISGKQDTSYVVTSNGGSAVKYGNYVYFINGSRGYEDDNGNSNKFGDVVKGGLYRAEFINEKGGVVENYNGIEGVKDFIPATDSETGISLASTQKLGYTRQLENVVNNQLLVPKTIGTSGYADGGIYIFDDYVYYATPANTKDKSGNIMDNYTTFLRTKLNGTGTEEIYTTQNASADKPYGFYKYNGKMYLYVMENNSKYGNYVNRIDISSKKVTTVAINVDSVIFPTNPIYYKGMSNDSVYDAIYIRYAANDFPAYKDDQVNRTGYVLSYMRPDGKEIVSFAEGNTTLDIVAVRENLVFYKDVYLTDTVLVARDYNSIFSADNKGFNERVYNGSAVASATEIYPFLEGAGSIDTNRISMLTITSSSSSSANGSSTSTQTLTYYNSTTSQGKTIGSGSTIAVQTHDTAGFYYVINDGTTTSLRFYNLASGSDYANTINSSIGTSTFKADKVGSYIVYTATLEEKFENYTFFTDLQIEDTEKATMFVGTRVKGDVRSSIKEIVIDENSFDKVKTAYKVDDKLSVSNLKIVLKYYEDEDEETVDEKIVDVKSSWVTGFDSSAAKDTLELTISYTDGPDSFATTYEISIS